MFLCLVGDGDGPQFVADPEPDDAALVAEDGLRGARRDGRDLLAAVGRHQVARHPMQLFELRFAFFQREDVPSRADVVGGSDHRRSGGDGGHLDPCAVEFVDGLGKARLTLVEGVPVRLEPVGIELGVDCPEWRSHERRRLRV